MPNTKSIDPNLELFEFSSEIIEKFRKEKKIPVDFYNKEGQILIHKKDFASPIELDRILRFISQGIYFQKGDRDKCNILDINIESEAPLGLSNTKLIDAKHTKKITDISSFLVKQVKSHSLNLPIVQKSMQVLGSVLKDFENESNAMNGILNILELVEASAENYIIELMVKRVMLAMAIKTRGTLYLSQQRDKIFLSEDVNRIMLSALLCDISYIKLKFVEKETLSKNEFEQLKQHPILSYLMLAHEASIDSSIKQNILLHHHPLRGVKVSNNYPSLENLYGKLGSLLTKYSRIQNYKHIAIDIAKQLKLLDQNILYDEDANIIAISSAFASLTSKTPWRKAYTSIQAVRKIINQNIFSYSGRITREFLDLCATSLCHNQLPIKSDDYLVVSVSNARGKIVQYELAKVEEITHLQSRPELLRVGTIIPNLTKEPRLEFISLRAKTFKKDSRRARYKLSQDNTRHIAYLLDPEEDKEIYNLL